ncbi:MAG: hypothetical protein ACOC97_01510 [Myxococcota bacterium]
MKEHRGEGAEGAKRDLMGCERNRSHIEIHGNSNEDTAGRIEVATPNGFDPNLAQLIRDTWPEVRGDLFADIELWIEPIDTENMTWTAGNAKELGMLSICPDVCLHLEIPSALRDEGEARTALVRALTEPFERTLP